MSRSITASPRISPEQDTGQLQGFVRGDDGFSFQVMQPKIETYRKLGDGGSGGAGHRRRDRWRRGTSNRLDDGAFETLSERKDSARVVADRLRRQMPPVPGGTLAARRGTSRCRAFRRQLGTTTCSWRAKADLARWAPKVGQALSKLPELVDVDAPTDGGTKQVQLTIDREAARRWAWTCGDYRGAEQFLQSTADFHALR